MEAKTTKLPRYVSVANDLEESVRALPPHSLMPTEQQLSKKYGVSRVTIRAALDLLENNGIITRERGRGTIVCPPKITRHLEPFVSFEQDMKNQDIEYTTEVQSFDTAVVPPDFIRRQLKISNGDRVGHLSLVRWVDDQAISHEMRYYPSKIAKKIDPSLFEANDTREVLERTIGKSIQESHWQSEIRSPSPAAAEALKVSTRTLVLENSYLWMRDEIHPVEAGYITYRIDRCKLRFDSSMKKSA
ncbi:MAG: GntR family transcriptional regulator [Rhodovibrionaceae bacterium]